MNEARGGALDRRYGWLASDVRRVFWTVMWWAVPAASALATVALILQVYWYERDFITLAPEWKSIALVAAFTLFLTSVLALITRRRLAPIAIACGLMVLLTVLSVVKFEFLRASLYALDFYYYTRPTEFFFLRDQYPRALYAGLAAGAAAMALAVLLVAADESRITRRRALGLVCLTGLMLATAYQWRGQRDKIYHFVGWYHVSALPASLPEAVGVLAQGGFLQGGGTGGTINSIPIAPLAKEDTSQPKPTIISILHESSFNTALFPIQCGGTQPEALYTSGNGKRYDLRVETYGGATWLTEYGLMLGISTYYFGDARSFIGYTMENRVKDSLPRQLNQDGYETVALYPSPKQFVNTGEFYRSLGIGKLLDYTDLGATSELERDRFYYAKAIEQIRAHKASGSKAPLALFLWTMASHGPYDHTIHQEVAPDGASICAKDGPWSEYIRRMLMAEDDLAWFSEQLKAEFPDEPFMLVGFGDHQPFLSQEFLKPASAGTRLPTKNSVGYQTFFRITGVNYEPDWSSVPASIDTPFLGNVMMRAARLPRHGFYNDRDKLMELCGGRYNDCAHQNEILSFHDRMIDSATIVNR